MKKIKITDINGKKYCSFVISKIILAECVIWQNANCIMYLSSLKYINLSNLTIYKKASKFRIFALF